ncbi:hypothetical protein [Rhodococcus opacus]|nr:hypothetical protein [Rhodococcus opacus]MBV6754897.1 hypothetical protein [Rhodococcus opacus]
MDLLNARNDTATRAATDADGEASAGIHVAAASGYFTGKGSAFEFERPG